MKTVTVLSLLAALAQAHPTQERAVEKAARAPHPGAAHELDKAGGFARSAAERQKPKRAPQDWGYGGWWGNFGGQQSAAPTGAPWGAPTGAPPMGAPTGAATASGRPTATAPVRVAAASSTSSASTTCKFTKSALPVVPRPGC